MHGYSVTHHFNQGCFDSLQFERCGLIRLEGWFSNQRLADLEVPKCFIGKDELPLFQVFRTHRPDVAAALKSDNFYQGFMCTYRVSGLSADRPTHLSLSFQGETIFETTANLEVSESDHAVLLDAQEVLHRDDIYGVGPPAPYVIDEVFQLARTLPGPLLDFGCGSGALVKRLRNDRVEAYGIELAHGRIIGGVLPEVRDYIRLYEGDFPLPYQTGEFESVFATEVIEHVTDYETALSELARITRNRFTITVPDISSIAVCNHNYVVPWHLLESTHVNFFTQSSLERLLGKYFPHVECARICPIIINDSCWFGSLVGVCKK